MHIGYVTARTPYGTGEEFILPEILELGRQGFEITVFPLRPSRFVAAGTEAAEVARRTINVPLISPIVTMRALCFSLTRLIATAKVVRRLLHHSGGMKKTFKNLAVLPKGLFIGSEISRLRIRHLHAHWASTSATAAYIAAYISGVPWSFTAHRWDITENNMLAEKAQSASFIRVISKDGRGEMSAYLPKDLAKKIRLLHVGVSLLQTTSRPAPDRKQTPIKLLCVANLLPVKGHRYLIDACRLLRERGLRMECHLIGTGPLLQELEKRVEAANLIGMVYFRGHLPHDKLIAAYEQGAFTLMVLPSIETEKGEKEGIPVALMEAMAAGIPVISTCTGGIPELLRDGAGLMVNPCDARALAEAIEYVITDDGTREKLAAAGRNRIEAEFSLPVIIASLGALFRQNS